MKNKLRKITIDKLEYLYLVTDKYHLGTETNTLTVKVFLSGHKQTPLIIEFLTRDDYYMGQLLNSGIKLKNCIKSVEEVVNLNEPKFIKELILLGQKKSWNASVKLDKQNGLDYLKDLGYEIDILVPDNLKLEK
ncbi:hypothetical protein [Soonwooa sp.]|uniref:hypothetical protein n=1 Tax=Soonwooa sp. TaxID=1938592 RepID=UPI00261B7BC8|nr:hypothetical protein [Soonwooa sp.]